MSIMRCDKCDREVDTDDEEMFTMNFDLGLYYCIDCYVEDLEEDLLY